MRHGAYFLASALAITPAIAFEVSPAAVTAVLTEDLTRDGMRDRAVLVERIEENAVDLYLYTGRAGGPGLDFAGRALGIAWTGLFAGTLPELSTTPQGSLRLVSQNGSVGRNRWRETVTIAWRGGRFVVAGFTFDAYDTLEPGLSRHCDANLLTGKGILDGAAFTFDAGGVPVDVWDGSYVPPECAAG